MSFKTVFTKASKFRGVKYPSRPTKFEADIKKGESISIRKLENGDSYTGVKTFKVGDVAEYDSWNLTYCGTIIKITDKTVTFDTNGLYDQMTEVDVKRLDMYEFARRNIDYDAVKISRDNAETRNYI